MPQYLLAVYCVDGQEPLTDEQMQTVYAQVEDVNTEMRDTRTWVFGGGLHPPKLPVSFLPTLVRW